MSKENIKTASLEEIRQMMEKGELFHDPHAPDGADLGPEFWAKAKVVLPKRSKSVHLKLDPEVFDFFVQISKGKGHLTRMQAVLKAYAIAQQRTMPPHAE